MSYRLGIDGLSPDVVTGYLSQLVISWPGLDFEEILVQETPSRKGDDSLPRWTTPVMVSIYRPLR